MLISVFMKEVLYVDTLGRVKYLAAERDLSLYKLSQICDVSYSTLKNTAQRNGQLTVDTIERICVGLNISMSEFFAEEKAGSL